MWPERVEHFLQNPAWGEDWAETVALKTAVRQHRQRFPAQGLSRDLFERIVTWKLRRQRQRSEHRRADLTDDLVSQLTRAAFSITHPDADILAEVRANTLQALPGVGIGVASAILALSYPAVYGVIDFRVWDEINERAVDAPRTTKTFATKDFVQYVSVIRPVAARLRVEVQVLDFALWKIWGDRRGK